MTTSPGPIPAPQVLRYAAFTHNGAGGNPAGVVLNAGDLDDAARLSVAAEVGYSETAFLDPVPGDEEPARLQFFSPRSEVAFCGHATVATAVAVAERRGPGPLVFDTAAGRVPVETYRDRRGVLTATLTSVPTRSRPAAAALVDEALQALRWPAGDLDPRYPPRVAYAGNDHLMIAAATRARLAHLDYDYPALEALTAAQSWTTLHLVWAQTPTVFHARDPFPPGGVHEDPATGAAAAAFGGYLRDLRLVHRPAQVVVLQGEDMGRPSRLLVDLPGGADPRVRVTGTADAIPDTS